MGKEYYTFIDIINYLRRDYRKAQGLLNEMKDCIYVEASEEIDIKLRLDESYLLNDNQEKKIIVSVAKNNHQSLINKIKNINYNNYASFYLTGNENSYTFAKRRSNCLHDKYEYQPKIYISKEKEQTFNEAYQELRKIKFFTFPNIVREFNPFQTIYIHSDSISLTSEWNYRGDIMIYYLAEDDKIHIESTTKYSPYFIKELLLTKIPKYIFPKEYIMMFDNEMEELEDTKIIDKIGERKEKLFFEDHHNSKEMVLRKDFSK